MPRSTHAAAVLLACALAACTKTSDSQSVVTAPVASASSTAGAGAPPSASATSTPVPVASASSAPVEGPGESDETEAPAQFRACKQDGDCVTVDRVGCCHNGWKVAVNATQKDAYTKSFTCPDPRPICPMFIVHDTRVAKCDAGSHLCVMSK